MNAITQKNPIMLMGAMAVAAAFLITPLAASAATSVVTPDNLQGWSEANQRGDGLSEITDTTPDDAGGNGSIEQSFSDGTGKTDWRLSGQDFGLANELSALSFDWYRDSNSTAPGHLTPAVGIYVADDNGNSWLLKWEGAYNGYPTNGPAVPTDTWTTEDLLNANYWRIPQTEDGDFVGFAGCNQGGDPFDCFQYDRSLDDAWLAGFKVVAVEIGIGSGWNGTYRSFADLLTINDTTFDFEIDVPEPVTPDQVTGIEIVQNNVSLGCEAFVTDRTITVNWDDSTAPDFDYYEYQADVDTLAPYDFTTSVLNSERTGMIRDEDGTYNYRVRAVSESGLKGAWSPWCSVTLDRVAPVATIINPEDGDTVSGVITLRGEVEDTNPENSYFRIEGPDGYVRTSLFSDGRLVHLYNWDTTAVVDGAYTIYFEVRDEAGNKLGSRATPDDSVAKIMVTVNNTTDDDDDGDDAGSDEDPVNKAQCIQGGWEDFGFKNQGQCIKFVNTEKDSRS